MTDPFKAKEVTAWAIWHKHYDIIAEVGFIDAGNFKPTKSMFVNDNGTPAWTGTQYKLIPVKIIYGQD